MLSPMTLAQITSMTRLCNVTLRYQTTFDTQRALRITQSPVSVSMSEEADCEGTLANDHNPMTRAVHMNGSVEEPQDPDPTEPASIWSLPPLPRSNEASVPFIVEDVSAESKALVMPHRSSIVSPSRSAHNEVAPMSVAMDGPNPSPHFVSLENVARLYLELKNERDFLLREGAKIFAERVAVVNSLRDLEVRLNALLQQKGRLEESLDTLGLRDEENREKISSMDEKVAHISSESQRFEATIRDLKGSAHPTKTRTTVPHPRPRPSAACRRTLYGHTGNVLGIDVSPQSGVIITASADRSLRTWDVSDGRRLDTLYGHEGWVHAVAFACGGERAVSGSGDKTVKIWDLNDARGRGTCRATLRGHEAGVTCVQLDDDNMLISGSLDKTLRYTDLGASNENCKVIQGHESGVYCLQFLKHGVASGGGDSVIRMHDMRTGMCHRTLKGHTVGAVRALQFNDTHLISGGTDCTLRFWDLRTGSCMSVVDVGARINALKFDEQRVIVACADRTLKVYNMETKEQLGEHGGHLGPVTSLTNFVDPASPQCFTAMTGSTDHSVKVWQLPGKEATR